jgi:hypothetical protein
MPSGTYTASYTCPFPAQRTGAAHNTLGEIARNAQIITFIFLLLSSSFCLSCINLDGLFASSAWMRTLTCDFSVELVLSYGYNSIMSRRYNEEEVAAGRE